MAPSISPDLDPFWVERREQFFAEKSANADPSACGTCRRKAEAGHPVEHDECQQRATILHAPDHPDYELLAGFSLEENAKLPARFHVPVFDDLGKPNAWLCAVCWEEGSVTRWPCKTAMENGSQVFSPLHEADTVRRKQQAELDELRAENARLRAERDELAVRARRVAISHEHFIWHDSDPGAEALASQYELVNYLSAMPGETELPLNPVENALRLVLALLDEYDENVTPCEIRKTLAEFLPRDDKSDNRRRIYVDGKGNGWISVCSDEGTEWVVPVEPASHVEQDVRDVADETGSLREIGRCW